MNHARRGLLELWAMAVLAAVVGFLGPFGTYLEADFPMRVWRWFIHLMGAYVLVRPTIWFLTELARATSLPRNGILLSGVVLAAFPLAAVWQWGASVFFQALGGFAGLLPFAFLSSVTILAVVAGAARVDEHLRKASRAEGDRPLPEAPPPGATASLAPVAPRLQARLSPGFKGPIIALQSEDHYVRVHGPGSDELVLMRLRDAIAEMDGLPGRQVHRGWWVAQGGIAQIRIEGRNYALTLSNGAIAPVARDSVAALKREGFLDTLEPKQDLTAS